VPISLTVADTGSGSATVTVAGSNSAASNMVYYATFNGANGSAWALGGSRTGDGTVSVTPGVGSWAWQCLSIVGGSPSLSNVALQALEDSTVAVHYTALLAIQSIVQGLALQDVPSGNVQVQWLPTSFTSADPTPGCKICPAGVETQPGSLTGQDDIGLGCGLILYDVANANYTAHLARNLMWRQQIFRKFRNRRLPGMPTSLIVTIEPKLVIDPQLFVQANLWGTGFLIRAVSREQRG
jgi:hypothetical protein